MLLIIGTPDENKTGLYFSRYEHVYLCNAIKGILIVDEYLQDYFILVDLTFLFRISHHYTKICNAMLTVRLYVVILRKLLLEYSNIRLCNIYTLFI